jgi:hypothetical protein
VPVLERATVIDAVHAEIALASRRPDLMLRLILAETTLEPVPPPTPGGVGVTFALARPVTGSR